mmetsp:Transcript_43312/g.119786  ORF Transcript_43312/g.119786 Transcript_43312/m.119786 type:complete len:350 (-) Transcript_43312:423-1472(-)
MHSYREQHKPHVAPGCTCRLRKTLRVEGLEIYGPGLPVDDELRHRQTAGQAIQNAPAAMTSGDVHVRMPWRQAHDRELVAADWEITRLLRRNFGSLHLRTDQLHRVDQPRTHFLPHFHVSWCLCHDLGWVREASHVGVAIVPRVNLWITHARKEHRLVQHSTRAHQHAVVLDAVHVKTRQHLSHNVAPGPHRQHDGVGGNNLAIDDYSIYALVANLERFHDALAELRALALGESPHRVDELLRQDLSDGGLVAKRAAAAHAEIGPLEPLELRARRPSASAVDRDAFACQPAVGRQTKPPRNLLVHVEALPLQRPYGGHVAPIPRQEAACFPTRARSDSSPVDHHDADTT